MPNLKKVSSVFLISLLLVVAPLYSKSAQAKLFNVSLNSQNSHVTLEARNSGSGIAGLIRFVWRFVTR